MVVRVNEYLHRNNDDIWSLASAIVKAPSYQPCAPIVLYTCEGACQRGQGEMYKSTLERISEILPNHRICGFTGTVNVRFDPTFIESSRPYISDVFYPGTNKSMPQDQWVKCIDPKPGTCNSTGDGPIKPNSLKNLGRPNEIRGNMRRN